jgi:hypothetical protein
MSNLVRRSLLTGIGAAGVALWYSRVRLENDRFTGGLYVQMGTSITAGLRAPDAYRAPAIVGERLQLHAVNVGFEGSYAGIGIQPDYDQISLCALSDAIASGDWTMQETAVARISDGEVGGETKPPILHKLKAIDFSRVTHLGMEYGTNDFTLNVPIGKSEDDHATTFKGALNHAVRRLMAAHPTIKMFFITPAWFLDEDGRDTNSYPNKAGFFLRDYVDAMLEIADLNSIKCLDMWRSLGINKDNYHEFTFDSKHPNGAGAKLRGELTASFIASAYNHRS